jgi:GTP-binding protein LepA
MVFAGFYPSDGDDEKLRSILHKLILNESSIHIEEEYSKALGAGFRCGFLGMLHLQIIRERLEKEFDAQLLVTAPSVAYRVRTKKGQNLIITNASFFPSFEDIDFVDEPIMNATITLPELQIGAVMQFSASRKGVFNSLEYKAGQAILHYEIPASEIAFDFFNRLKSLTRGYASMETSFKAYQKSNIVRMDVQVNYIPVDALTILAHRDDTAKIAADLTVKLKHSIPRKLYPMPVQVLVENRVIGRADIPPLRKNQAVNGEKRSLSKKKELLRRQRNNRKQMAEMEISLPQEVFNVLLEVDAQRV